MALPRLCSRAEGLEPIALRLWNGQLDDNALRQEVARHCCTRKGMAPKQTMEGIRHLLAQLTVIAASDASEAHGGQQSVRSHAAALVWECGQLQATASRAASKALSASRGRGQDKSGGRGRAGLKRGGSRGRGGRAAAVQDDGEAWRQKVELQRQLAQGKYDEYCAGWTCPVRHTQPHSVLAVDRGQSEKALTVRVTLAPQLWTRRIEPQLTRLATERLSSAAGFSVVRRCLTDAAVDGGSRLLLPALYRQTRRRLSENAAVAATASFQTSLRALLLAPPCKYPVVMGIDPGFRHGCKLAVIGADGALLSPNGTATVYPTPPAAPNLRAAAAQKVLAIARQHGCRHFVVGNGQGHRETCEFLAHDILPVLLPPQMSAGGAAGPGTSGGDTGHGGFTVVSESGASIYSVSALAAKELPSLPASLRGAVTIARRVLDPLAEFIKLDPTTLGVGMYQKDLKTSSVKQACDEVVESCVHWAGVDINTASEQLLTHIAGLGPKTAAKLIAGRPFSSRSVC
eukprot:COSAG05_NODE_1881_length_3907_cov_92.844275_3_plen_515_part_00